MSEDTIKCRDCPTEFEFTAGERAFYEEKGFQPPRRCKPCRDARKVKLNGEAPMAAPTPTAAEIAETPRRTNGPRRKGGRRDDRDER